MIFRLLQMMCTVLYKEGPPTTEEIKTQHLINPSDLVSSTPVGGGRIIGEPPFLSPCWKPSETRFSCQKELKTQKQQLS